MPPVVLSADDEQRHRHLARARGGWGMEAWRHGHGQGRPRPLPPSPFLSTSTSTDETKMKLMTKMFRANSFTSHSPAPARLSRSRLVSWRGRGGDRINFSSTLPRALPAAAPELLITPRRLRARPGRKKCRYTYIPILRSLSMIRIRQVKTKVVERHSRLSRRNNFVLWQRVMKETWTQLTLQAPRRSRLLFLGANRSHQCRNFSHAAHGSKAACYSPAQLVDHGKVTLCASDLSSPLPSSPLPEHYRPRCF